MPRWSMPRVIRGLMEVGGILLLCWLWPGAASAQPRSATGHATAPPLGAVPSTCPSNPPPTDLPHDVGAAIGMSPVWTVGFTPGLSLHLGNPRLLYHGPHGWYRKVAWAAAPGYRLPIRVHGGTLDGRMPLWFQVGEQLPTTSPVLDPLHPVVTGNTWGELFTSYIFIPKAGCYFVEASWPGGTWRLAFAAGQ